MAWISFGALHLKNKKKLAPSSILREAKIACYARNMFEAGRFFFRKGNVTSRHEPATLISWSYPRQRDVTPYRSPGCADVLRGARADVTDFSYMTLMDTSAVKHNMLKICWQLSSRYCWNLARRLTCSPSASVTRKDYNFDTWTDPSFQRHSRFRPTTSGNRSGQGLISNIS